MSFDENDISRLLEALSFATDKHRNQRRKDAEKSPYINHPVKVAEILWKKGNVREIDVIIAGLLHDTIEDTDTSFEEIKSLFGEKVASYVSEVTDDRTLEKSARKQMQIVHAPHISHGAKQVKLADKISNVHDMIYHAPDSWPLERKIEYLDWADQVFAGLRGCNPNLEKAYDEILSEARKKLV
jgi:guanosine-3',5'-bis(diphosphate) 3'-pyrophosphohydrolase